MRILNLTFMATLCVVGSFTGGQLIADDAASSQNEQSADKAIRAGAQQFVEDFGRHDAQALAAHWTPDGIYLDEEGERFEGRQAIQQQYEQLFQVADNVKLLVDVDSVRLLSPDTAIEEGRAAIVPQPHGQPRVMSRYTAVLVKHDGQWLMADVRDTREVLPADLGQLQDLDWLTGNWRGAAKNARTDVKFQWIVNKQFLSRAFATAEPGEESTSGLEIIGMDAATGQITSWSFTSDGGHAVGYWFPHDDGWLVRYDGVVGNGAESSAVNMLTREGDDTVRWISQDRIVDDKPLPDLGPVILTRK